MYQKHLITLILWKRLEPIHDSNYYNLPYDQWGGGEGVCVSYFCETLDTDFVIWLCDDATILNTTQSNKK